MGVSDLTGLREYSFLDKRLRGLEVAVTVYGFLVGLVTIAFSGGERMGAVTAFKRLSDYPEILAGSLLLIFTTVHIAGVIVNGKWKYSPFLRLVGVLGHLFVQMALLLQMVIFVLNGHAADAGAIPGYLRSVFAYGLSTFICLSIAFRALDAARITIWGSE